MPGTAARSPYAISDRQVLNTYMGFQAEPEVHLLNAELDEARTDPEVCDAAEELAASSTPWTSDPRRSTADARATYTGLPTRSPRPVLPRWCSKVGEAKKLLRMLPCRGTDGSSNP